MTTRKNASRNVTPATVPTIVLKTIHDDIIRDNKTSTLTTKKMRVRLRATPATKAIHVANASWIFTQAQYDVVRSMFDAGYAARIARKAKASTRVKAKVEAPVVVEA